nr:hypothetical protein StreXyl84_65900 [Streptomyces sp. Xyl84]
MEWRETTKCLSAVFTYMQAAPVTNSPAGAGRRVLRCRRTTSISAAAQETDTVLQHVIAAWQEATAFEWISDT